MKISNTLLFLGFTHFCFGQTQVDSTQMVNHELKEVVVKERILIDATKIEIRVVMPKESEAPIGKNFIKNLPGISKSSEDFNYLNKTIFYYLDGVSISKNVIEETLTNSLETVEIYFSPTAQFWMKPGEVIFNFKTKKVKEPKAGLNLTTTIGFLLPYNYGQLNYYYLDKRYNVRISTLGYLNRNNEKATINQQLDNKNSVSNSMATNQAKPNFNTFVFNYFVDSTKSISFQHLNSTINAETQSRFNYQPFGDSEYLRSTNATTYDYHSNDSWLTFTKKSHVLYLIYSYSNTNRTNVFTTNQTIDQNLEDNSSNFNFNYSNYLNLLQGVFTYNLSFESIASKSNFRTNVSNAGGSNFNSHLWSVKSNYQKSIKNLNVNVGARLDFINQDIETFPVNDPFKINKVVLLPIFSLNVTTENYGTLTLSFNQDYSIPEISKLSKFSKQIDPYSIVTGNSRLQNEKKMELGFSHSYQNDKWNIITTIGFDKTNDVLNYGTYVVSNNLLQQTYGNIGNFKKYGFATNVSYNFSEKISNQFSIDHSLNNYSLNPELQFNTFDENWKSSTSITNSTIFSVSKNLETTLNLSFKNYEYTFFSKESFTYPAVSYNVDLNLGKDWYSSFYWGTIFSNANLSEERTFQPNYSSTNTLLKNQSNFELSLRKVFGNKRNTVTDPKNNFDGVQSNVKK
jgi:predicted DNA-binding protein YlxM (UPF0122 family)